jgi:integrase/recombinase XerD
VNEVISVGRAMERNFILGIEDAYAAEARDFVRFVDSRGLDIDYNSVRAYLDDMKGRGVPAQTYNKRLAAIKKRIRQMFDKSAEALDLEKKYRMEEALKTLKAQKLGTRRIDRDSVLNKEEILSLIDPSRGKRFGLIIEFLAFTGLRVSELCSIRKEDLRMAEGHYLVRVHGKGGKERMVKVSIELIEYVERTFEGKEWLFETRNGQKYKRQFISSEVSRVGLRVLSKHISAHSLRHAFATAAIKDGWSPKKVASQLGHSSTSITLDMYVEDSPAWRDLQKLWNKDYFAENKNGQ